LRIIYVGWADSAHVARWAGHFTGLGHKAWVLSPKPASIPGVKVIHARMRHRGIRLQALELKLHHVMSRADLVHVHWAGFAGLPFRAGIEPYVVTAWGSDIYRIDGFDAYERELTLEGLRHAALITVDSRDLKRATAALGIDEDKIEVIQWGVDTSLFRPDLPTGDLRAELGLDSDTVIYSPRDFMKVYNVDVVFAAFRNVLEMHPDALLIQKYYNPDRAVMENFLARAEEMGIKDRLRLVGKIEYSRLPWIYNCADVVVSVPSSDGTPMAVLEAMACGKVPIVSDLPSLREWIEDGVNGHIVPVRDPGALTGKILEVLADRSRSRSMGASNLPIIHARADQGEQMKRMERMCQDLIGERVGAPA